MPQYGSFQPWMCVSIAERGRERPNSLYISPQLLAWNWTCSINKSRRSADQVPESEHYRRIGKRGNGWFFLGCVLDQEKGWGRRLTCSQGRMFLFRLHPGLDHSYLWQWIIQKENRDIHALSEFGNGWWICTHNMFVPVRQDRDGCMCGLVLNCTLTWCHATAHNLSTKKKRSKESETTVTTKSVSQNILEV